MLASYYMMVAHARDKLATYLQDARVARELSTFHHEERLAKRLRVVAGPRKTRFRLGARGFVVSKGGQP